MLILHMKLRSLHDKNVYGFQTGDQKLVGAFTRNVYEFLRSFITSSGNFDAKICAKSEVLPAVQKVLDSRVPEARELGGKGESSDRAISFFLRLRLSNMCILINKLKSCGLVIGYKNRK